MSDRDKFQGLCLENFNGYEYMDIFDDFSPAVRKRLRDSPYNLCSACVHKYAGQAAERDGRCWGEVTDADFITAMTEMEHQIRT